MNQTNRPMTFENLQSWQEARQMTREIYSLTRSDSNKKDFGWCVQIQRAGVSVMSNTAEGFERQHVQEKLQLHNIAHASTAKVRSLCYLTEDNLPPLATKAIQLR